MWIRDKAGTVAGPAPRILRPLRPGRHPVDRLRGVFPVRGRRPLATTAGHVNRLGGGALCAAAGNTAVADHLVVAERRF